MRNTTEKSIEVNVLRRLVNWLEIRLNEKITVLSPTQQLEFDVGYDDFLQGLPDGMIIALQFKRPEENGDMVDFTLNVPQMTKMDELFPTNCAFYVFSPFPTHLELISNYDNLLDDSMAIDVHDISNIVVTNSATSTVRFHPNNSRQISDNGQFHDLDRLFPVSDFCPRLKSKNVGKNSKEVLSKVKNYIMKLEDKNNKGLEIYFLHIPNSNNVNKVR